MLFGPMNSVRVGGRPPRSPSPRIPALAQHARRRRNSEPGRKDRLSPAALKLLERCEQERLERERFEGDDDEERMSERATFGGNTGAEKPRTRDDRRRHTDSALARKELLSPAALRAMQGARSQQSRPGGGSTMHSEATSDSDEMPLENMVSVTSSLKSWKVSLTAFVYSQLEERVSFGGRKSCDSSTSASSSCRSCMRGARASCGELPQPMRVTFCMDDGDNKAVLWSSTEDNADEPASRVEQGAAKSLRPRPEHEVSVSQEFRSASKEREAAAQFRWASEEDDAWVPQLPLNACGPFDDASSTVTAAEHHAIPRLLSSRVGLPLEQHGRPM